VTPPVAVAVVSWNTRELLRRCLTSLAPEVQGGRADVWVVDNASSDGSADLVRGEFPAVNLIASRENLGFGRAVNLVAERTASDWIAAANADVALRPGALDALLEAGARDPRAGAIAPRLLLPDGSTQHSVHAFPSVPWALVLASGAFHLSPALADRLALVGHWDSERARRVPWALAAFLLVRRRAWDEIGGFDERQWMYAEDLDLGWRLQRAGWATRYEPRALVDHESAAATTQLWGEELGSHWQRSTYGFIARRRGPLRAWSVALLSFAGSAARWAIMEALRLRTPRERAALGRWALVHLGALRGGRALKDYR
jgi:N-acetylglucosaminyl-diphospho-decaprenol L-rhamnosyltransferase